MPYTHFTPEELAADESFQNWVFKLNEKDIQYWEQWIRQHPHKQKTIQEAVRLLTQLHFAEQTLSPAQTEASWQKLDSVLNQKPGARAIPVPEKVLFSWQKMAATLTGLLLIAGLYFFVFRDTLVSHQTGYAQMSTITLPDGSTVTLNGNSSVRYKSSWKDNMPREVWLKGEAFFKVKKQIQAQPTAWAKFIVHASQMDVQVLGTSFNVSDRRGKTRVVLNTGKVQLANKSADADNATIMQPGEMAVISEKEHKIVKQAVNPENFSSWINKKLVFDNTTIREIALLLEETYGLEVVIKEPSLLEQKVSGSIPNDNIDVLLNALSRSFDLHIIRTGKRLQLQNRE